MSVYDTGGYIGYKKDYPYVPLIKDGLVLHLDAGDTASYPGSGTTWFDLSGNGNNGTLTNGPTFSSDNGGTLVFDGTNDYINGVHNAQLDITGDATIEVWFKLTNARSDWVRVFGKGDSTNRTIGLWFNQTTSSFLYQRYGSTNMDASYGSTVSLNTWFHMVGTSSSNNHVLYINAVQRATSSSGTTFFSSTSPYTVGYHGSIHTYHIGNIPVCRLYNRGLSTAEVTQNFNSLRGRFLI